MDKNYGKRVDDSFDIEGSKMTFSPKFSGGGWAFCISEDCFRSRGRRDSFIWLPHNLVPRALYIAAEGLIARIIEVGYIPM